MLINLPAYPWLPEGWWVAISAVATLVAASVTALMAWYTRSLAIGTSDVASKTRLMAEETRDLVRSGAEERVQIEVHHQQSLSPLVVIEGSIRPTGITLDFTGVIRNVGPGPAIDVDVYVIPDTARSAHKRLGSIAAGEVWELNLSWTGLIETSVLEYIPYHAVVMYWSIFQTRGYTRLRSYSGKRADTIVEEAVLPSSAMAGEVTDVEQEQLAKNPAPAKNGMTNRLP